jgi:hypothetical protein
VRARRRGWRAVVRARRYGLAWASIGLEVLS